MKTKSFRFLIKTIAAINVLTISLLFSSCEEKDLMPIADIGVSQGTYIQIIHLSWDPVEGAQYYNIERQGPDGEWRAAGTVTTSPFDDYGFNLPQNKLVEGVEYNYRIVSASSDLDDSEPAYAQREGWTHIMEPLNITIVREKQPQGYTYDKIHLTWTDPNAIFDVYGNAVRPYYVISRKYSDEVDFTVIKSRTDIGATSFTDEYVDKTKKATYKLEGKYEYQYKNMDNDYTMGFYSKTYDEIEEEGSITPESNYNIENLGDLPASADGYGFLKLKNIDSKMYLAAIPKPTLGSPAVYKLNGTAWQNISDSYPDGLLNNFETVSICGDGTTLWAAGVSDSAYVYAFNGSWSNNIAVKNMGLSGKPGNLLVEFMDDALYALAEHDNKLEMFKLDQNGNWNSENTLEDNVSGLMDLEFRKFNNKLYAFYTITNSSNNSTVKIRHLAGSSWTTDFEKAYDNIMNLKFTVADNGDIFFTSDSQDPGAWAGNVFKVTSASTAQELVSSSDTWLTFPGGIAMDNNGNPVVVYSKFISATEPAEAHLSVYEDGQWKVISGDFSKHIFPSAVESMNGVYFVYGDGNSTTNSYPNQLKGKLLTK